MTNLLKTFKFIFDIHTSICLYLKCKKFRTLKKTEK